MQILAWILLLAASSLVALAGFAPAELHLSLPFGYSTPACGGRRERRLIQPTAHSAPRATSKRSSRRLFDGFCASRHKASRTDGRKRSGVGPQIRARVFAICCGYEDADDLDDGERLWTDLRVWAYRGEIVLVSGRASRRPDRLDLKPPGGWLPTYGSL